MDRIELYYQVAHANLLEQDQRNRDLELKASGALGLGVTLLGIAALIMTDFSGGARNLQLATLVFGGSLGVTFLFVFGYALQALWVRKWDRRPLIKELQNNVLDKGYPDEALLEWVADAIMESHKINGAILDKKAGLVKWTMIALCSEALLLALLAISTRF